MEEAFIPPCSTPCSTPCAPPSTPQNMPVERGRRSCLHPAPRSAAGCGTARGTPACLASAPRSPPSRDAWSRRPCPEARAAPKTARPGPPVCVCGGGTLEVRHAQWEVYLLGAVSRRAGQEEAREEGRDQFAQSSLPAAACHGHRRRRHRTWPPPLGGRHY